VTVQSIDYLAVAAPLILALAAGLVLLLDAFLPRRPHAREALGVVALAGVAAALAAVLVQAGQGRTLSTFCVPPDLAGAGPAPCSFVVDGLTLPIAGLVLVAGAVVVLLSMGELAGGRIPVGEWYFLLLCVLAGAVALPAARDLVMLVVALELVSLPVFALAALKRYDGRATEAAVKLFVVSVVSTAVMLFGVSLLYGLTGTMHLDRLAAALGPGGGAALPTTPAEGLPATATSAYTSRLELVMDVPTGAVTVAAVLVLAGFAFKVAAVPFHAWAGDVYQGAPVPVAALLSVISKAAGFAGLILVLLVGLAPLAATWAPLVAVVAALTMTVGNLLALRQRQAVRLLAWSSVAHSGYILAPLAVAGAGGVRASLAYLLFYAAMNLGAFAVVMLVSRSSERGELDDYRGLASHRPAAALSLAFFLVCLAGLPPGLAGLFAKIVVFREVVAGGWLWLAVVMAVNTVVGLYYYALWAARLFTPAPASTPATPTPETTFPGRAVRAPIGVAVAVALVITVLLSVAPQAALDLLPAALPGHG
jgi:NADH-quinone oxidoreductase subunit N